MEKFCKRLDNLSNNVDDLWNKLVQIESSLALTKTANDHLLNRFTSLERGLHAQEQYSRREYIVFFGIAFSVDDKRLQ